MSDINDVMNSKHWKDLEKVMEVKKKTLKRGENVIHLEYIGGMISEKDILNLENKLKSAGIELSSFDKSGVPYANFDELTLVSFLAISQPIINNLIKGVGVNATWDVIKYSLILIWEKIRNKSFSKISVQEIEKAEITFGLKVKLDKNTSFNFKLDGNIDKEIIENSIDKIFDFIKTQKMNDSYKNTDFVYFDSSLDKWKKIDVDKAIRKMIKGKKKNK